MPQYTEEELLKMGAKPVVAPQTGYREEDLIRMGAKPLTAPPPVDNTTPPPKPLPATQGTEFGLLFGVDPTTFGRRILGAASTVTNTLFPAGDVPRPNTLPELGPQEEIGAKAATLATVPEMAGAVKGVVGAGVRAGVRAGEAFIDRPRNPVTAMTQALKP